MTSPGPAPGDMLLPPAMVEDPSPLRVSTFAKPEYAKLTFTYGKVKDPSATWPVHCKHFQVRFRTGRQAAALTSEPRLIRHELTVPPGKRQWTVDRDDRDPNEVIFTCSPPPGEPAAFDGSWSVQLELTGIEVNGSPSPVSIDWEESTSATGEAGPYIERTGRGEVSKRDDSFYLHSFRPATVAINRGTKATLHWEGTPNADYTMYYRAQDGSQQASEAKEGVWESPVTLLDDTTFTLEAKMGSETRYLTTNVKVNNPDIVVNKVTANGAVDAKDTVTVAANKTLTVNGPIQANDTVTVAANKTFTANGPVQANDTVTVKAGKTLTAHGPIQANDTVTVKAGKTLTAHGPIQANDTVTIAAGKTLTANGPIKAMQEVIVDPGPSGRYYGLRTTRIWAFDGTSAGTVSFKSKISAEQEVTLGNSLIAKGPVKFETALFSASPTRANYAKSARKPREGSKWTMTATKDGFLVVEAASYEWFTDDEKHGRKHRIYVQTPGITYFFDLVAHGKKTRQSSQGIFGNMSVPVAKGSSVSVWISDIDDVASADGNVAMNICWYSLGA
ncbi:hypothetical protein [Streptomyces tubercidicus]|uniref:Uncharacterized protein n=1 Tax=Streptomyces tubercidicus TaxID=47759 RepID=A0A640ULV3_9ACTN|nr:hypothetical protein [Streptomyces tubercidicus]WAU11071.1 phage tail family protein [Streptomyces tubercidicus]GFE36282.1 hypothetical protein Stube_09550 [Streptomyces tubercidicus]